MIEHPILGTIDPSRAGSASGALELDSRSVLVDLILREDGVAPAIVEDALAYLESLPELDAAARVAIGRDAESAEDAPALLFAEHHIDELADEELDQLVGTHERESVDPGALLARLSLVQVVIYPEVRDRQLVLDYSLEPALTEYSLSVAFDATGEPRAISVDF